jgi:acyl-CoA reductase-like NAD-dependent aldehyde dehydrogenase
VVSFTGSFTSGRKVAETTGRRVRKMVLELSGKDGLIVCEDVADLDFAASAIVYGAFFNCGQLCSSVERVYVQKKIASQLIEKVVALVKSLKVGNGLTPGMDLGPLANQRQFDIVAAHVEEAKKAGAKVLTGGYKLTDGDLAKGLFYAPTVITGVNHDMRIMREIMFGPVVTFMTYDTIEEAIKLANDTNYGLGTAVLTQNQEMEEWLVRRLDSGMVWINEPLLSVAPCTWSVIKDSGYGGELGESGYKEYTFEKVIFTQYENNKVRPWYLPYQK